MGRALSPDPAAEAGISRLTDSGLRQAVVQLAGSDPRLAALFKNDGYPPRWDRPEGYPTMVKIILEQQVSLDSAAAAYKNLETAIGPVEPAAFLKLDDAELKQIGFSRQKAGYCRELAQRVIDGSVDLSEVGRLDDAGARSVLEGIKGIGPWTADVYLLFALQRPDIWPLGDRALVVSMAESLPLEEVPSYESAAEIAAAWRPWRSVAARLLWQAYLARRGRSLD